MKIINSELDFRGWPTFTIQSKRDEKEVRKEFQEMYPQTDVAVHTPSNLENTYIVTLMPKEDSTSKTTVESFEFEGLNVLKINL